MIEDIAYLYKIENKLNGKVYIGITNNPARRFREHIVGWGKSSVICKAITKYGEENFNFEVLCCGNRDYIVGLEGSAIEVYSSAVHDHGYNIKTGTQEANLLPEESRSKISESLKVHWSKHPHPNLNKLRKTTDNVSPVYCSGFWFTNKEVAKDALKLSNETYAQFLNKNSGEKPHKTPENQRRYTPCYVAGFWFPDRVCASYKLNLDITTINSRISRGQVEQSSSKGTTKEEVYVAGFWFPSIFTASQVLGLSESALKRRISLGDVESFYANKKRLSSQVRNRRVRKTPYKNDFKYVGGFWFPNIGEASSALKLPVQLLQERIRNGNIEQHLKIRKARPCYIHGFWFPSRKVACEALRISEATLCNRLKLIK